MNPVSQLNTTILKPSLRKPLGIALMMLGLLVSSAGMAQSVPTPWNGTRDQSRGDEPNDEGMHLV